MELNYLLITNVGLSVRHSVDLNWLQSGIIIIIIIIISTGDLKGETESEIVAAQNQALKQNIMRQKYRTQETDSKCKLCQQFDETIDHISAFSILAKEQYIKRHDRECAQLHFNICKETGVQLDKKHWYKHVPKSVETSQEGKVTIL